MAVDGPERPRVTKLFGLFARSLVAVQIAADFPEAREKARSIQVYMSTFGAVVGKIRGELNSYLVRSPGILLTPAYPGHQDADNEGNQ